MNAKNIFDLIGEFSGVREDQLTAGFAALLANSPTLLLAFLKGVGIKINRRHVKHAKIETQAWSDYNRLDLRISFKDEILIYVENKLTAPTTLKQIKDYLADLIEKKHRKKLFVLISALNEEEMLQKAAKKRSFKNVKNLLWKDVLEIIKKTNLEKDKKFLFKQFVERWGETMEGRILLSEQRIGETEEVLVVVVGPECMKYIKKARVCVPPKAQKYRPVQYVAFYVSAPVKALTYIAKVKEMRYNVSENELPQGSRGYYAQGDTRPYPQVIYLEEPIELSNKLGPAKNMSRWGGKYTTIVRLMSSKNTLQDLLMG